MRFARIGVFAVLAIAMALAPIRSIGGMARVPGARCRAGGGGGIRE